MMLKDQMTESEIVDAFQMYQHSTHIENSDDFRSHVLMYLSGYLQAMYNYMNGGDMMLTNYPDWWHEGHNKFVDLFQKYRYD